MKDAVSNYLEIYEIDNILPLYLIIIFIVGLFQAIMSK